MKKVIILKGLPGSGKSTWGRETLQANPGAYKRINKDDLRDMLDGGHYSGSNEKFVLATRDALIRLGLQSGKHVIVDDTNLNPKHEDHIRQLVSDYRKETGESVAIEIKTFDTPIEECIARDLKRARSVGERVIRKMYDDFLRVAPAPIAHDPLKRTAVICDLDGTLALLNGRNPYDASTCESDVLNEVVAEILYNEQRPIILVSGRSSEHREQTIRWLQANDIHYRALLMREKGDCRKDAIVKQEILERDILPEWNVAYVLDDRSSVVALWRSLGITCLQVAEGDF